MYTEYYGFSEKPFNVTPDPRFLFLSRGHREALASLTYGIQERRGFMVLVGEVGTGKTLLINTLRERLDATVSVASLTNTDISFEQMLHQILVEFDLAAAGEHVDKIDALERLKGFANRQLAEKGNVAIIIDEAQNLDAEILEKIRLLSNTETQQHKLLQIILSGQPELDLILDQHQMRQFSQRISLRRSIDPLSEKETYRYIKHHFLIIDYDGPDIFSKSALRTIWKYTKGVPRKINILCDNVFLIGYALDLKEIKAATVEEAVDDLHWSPEKNNLSDLQRENQALPLAEQGTPNRWYRFAAYLACGIVCVVIGAGGWVAWQKAALNRVALTTENQRYGKNASHPNVTPEIEKSNEGLLTHDRNQDILFADIPAGFFDTDLRSGLENPDVVFNIQTQTTDPSQNRRSEAALSIPIKTKPFDRQNTQIDDVKKSFEKSAVKIIVKKGDTLSTIIGAKNFSIYKNALPGILRLNPELSNPNRLKVGQVIILPSALAMKAK